MTKSFKLWTLGFILLVVVVAISCTDNIISPKDKKEVSIEREQQHIVAIENGANPSLGPSSVPSDGQVSNGFVSHLPLVVIDLNGQQIPVTKETTADQQVIYNGEDPYIAGNLCIIDNGNYCNSVTDAPAFSNAIRIKYRGNYSLNFDKKQYGIKLVDENGESVRKSILGMEENNDWILNISQLDQSLMRNYLSYNIGSALFPGTPECKYCEVLLKNQNEYTYQGVYLMMEKVEKGKGRVELADYTPGDKTVEYLLCRDREDSSEVQISTYGNETNTTSGRLSVLYPDEDVIDDVAFSYIENDIDTIEKVIYSDKDVIFDSWSEYIDLKSFSEYMIFNELFGNYDAGDNSTYMYKKNSSKLCMGPVWDYDGAMDNGFDIANPEDLAFYESAWFEKLVTSKKFMRYTNERYKALTENKGILSDEYINSYIDDVEFFLGNAALRDRSRWDVSYSNSQVKDQPDSSDYIVVRESKEWNEEVDRLRDYFVIKELYLGDSLNELYSKADESNVNGSVFAIVMIVMFTCSIVLIRRRGTFR